MAKKVSSAQRSPAKQAQPEAIPVHGRTAVSIEGAEKAEVKATIAGKAIEAAMKTLGLSPKLAEQRLVYFFDTPDLGLFNSGLVARARRVPGGAHDSTIKRRPIVQDEISRKWHDVPGFKIEADIAGRSIILSASLTKGVAKGLIKKVEAKDAALDTIFDDDQERFLSAMSDGRANLAKLSTLGPATTLCWRVLYPGLPTKMTAELWTLDNGQQLLEVSMRVPADQAAFAHGGFLSFLEDLGANPDGAQQTKTRWALTYFAAEVVKAKPKPRKAVSTQTTNTASAKSKAKGGKAAAAAKAPAAKAAQPAAKPAKQRSTTARNPPSATAEPSAGELHAVPSTQLAPHTKPH